MKREFLPVVLAISLPIWIVAGALSMCSRPSIKGPATVIDGDTIRIRSQSIRLQGIDAEEIHEMHGFGAKFALEEAVEGKIVTCYPDGTHSYKRVVAICYADGIDIATVPIASGWALDCPRYSHGRYRAIELPGARDHLIQKPYC